MISSLAKKQYGTKTANTDAEADVYAAAKHSYEKGARSSSVAKFTISSWEAADSLAADEVTQITKMTQDKSKYQCVFTAANGLMTTFTKGHLKGTITSTSSAIEIYLTEAMSAVCGVAPYQGTSTYVATYAEPECDTGVDGSATAYGDGAVGNFADGDSITCTATDGEVIKVTASARQLKGRSLKGFSTGGAAKMDGSKSATCKTQSGLTVKDCTAAHTAGDYTTDPAGQDPQVSYPCASKEACEAHNNKWTAAVPQEMEFVMAWQFHGMSSTYADDHVQMALAGLIEDEAYSTCTTGANDVDGGGDPTKCSGDFVWGNVICKKISDRALVIPDGTSVAGKNNECEKCDDIEEDICGKVTNFYDMPGAFNVEVAKKVAVYGNAWMYVIHEFEDAIQDCLNADLMDNDASVHAWDEGVAFYVGSLGAESDGDDPSTWGKMIYELANMR
jgi:hypothetical protein